MQSILTNKNFVLKTQGKGKKQGKRIMYQGILYRSSWEVYLAKLLLYSDCRFKYEPKVFYFSNRIAYCPDFYLPDYDVWIEVKGSLTKIDKLKIDLFKRNTKETLIYVGKNEIEYILGLKISSLPSPDDILDYRPTRDELERLTRIIHDSQHTQF